MRSLSRPASPPLLRPVTRRAAQGLLAGALVTPLVGCDLLPESASPRPPAPSVDETLVESVAAAIRAAREVAAAAPGGQPLVDVHAAHLEALGATPDSPTSSATPAAPTADLRGTEVALEATLTEAAGRVEDGGLARLLASMAASIAQHLAARPAGQGAAR